MDGTLTEKVNYKAPKLDEYGNPIVKMKTIRGGSRGFFKLMRKESGGKRGRPQTKPAKAASTLKYAKRGTEKGYYSKGKVAERKAKAQAKREAKAAAKAAELAANFGLTPKVRKTLETTAARSAISMRTIESRRRKPLPNYVPGFAGIPTKSRGRKIKVSNMTPFSTKVGGAPAPKLAVVSGPFS